MRKPVSAMVMLALLAVTGTAALQEQPQAAAPISWDNWKAAKESAVKADDEGRFKEAYEFYLEYIRQAEGLNQPEIVAWGKNNAAFMLIKMHKQDASVDLAPAKKLLEEGMAIPEATADCKKALETNMAYVDMFLGKK
jgi:hypothetical protein